MANLKYGIGDLLSNLATDGHLIIQNIKMVGNDPWYCAIYLEDGTLAEYKAKSFDQYAHFIKVA